MGRASKEDVEKAFTAGFEDKDFDTSAEVGDKDLVAEAAAKTTESEDQVNVETAEKTKTTETIAPGSEVDEWEGIPDQVRARFETMATSLKQATDMAKTASGRANKLQSFVDKQKNLKPVEKPVPTEDRILGALTNKDTRNALREDFPDFASALDEMDKSVSTSVGSAMDNMRTESVQQTRNMINSLTAKLELERNLDIKHPGWETTVKNKDFKDWAYKGGPSEQERTHYEALLSQANVATPENSAEAYQQANDYYSTLLANSPVWANEKGSLYGDSSGDAAIALLDSFKLSKPSENTTTQAELTVNKNRQRLEDNIAPTIGNGIQVPQSDDEDVEKAFHDGFTNSSY